MKLCIHIISLVAFSCSPRSNDYKIHSLLKCLPVAEGYVYCEPGSNDEDNCILNYSGKKYVKKDRILLKEDGTIKNVDVFKSEGIIRYSSADVDADPLLWKSNGWKFGNRLTISGDSIVAPFKARIIENNFSKQIVYASLAVDGRLWLYVFAYSKNF